MKNSLLIFGITLISLTNVCNATNTVGKSSNPFQEEVSSKENEDIFLTEKTKIVKPPLTADVEVFNPETVIVYNSKTVKEIIAESDKIIENTTSDDLEFMAYEESMKEIIAQSDLIIENTFSNEFFPLYAERTIENEIAELEMVIESPKNTEVSPLDFKKINRNSLLINSFNSERFIGMN